MREVDIRFVEQMKRDAKKLKRATPGLIHCAALDIVAQREGFRDWRDVMAKAKGGDQ